MNALARAYRAQYMLRRRWAAVAAVNAAGASPQPAGHELARGRIAVACTGLLGDTIMCLPAARALRTLMPEAWLTGLVDATGAELVRDAGIFDDVLLVPSSWYPLRPAKRRRVREFGRTLRSRRYDAAVVLLGDDVVPHVAMAGIPVRVGASDTVFSPLLTSTYPFPSPREWNPHTRLGVLECLGAGSPPDAVPTLSASAGQRTAARALLQAHGVGSGQTFVVLHPYASTPNRCLSRVRVRELAAALASRTGAMVVVVGRSANHGRLHLPRVIDLTNESTIAQLIGLVAGARLVVSTDSGPMHLAGALRVPAVGLLRAIRPELAGLYPSVTPIVWTGGPACLPACSWDSEDGCAARPCRQLDGITISQIVDAVDRTVG